MIACNNDGVWNRTGAVAEIVIVRLEERAGERSRMARDLHDTLPQGFQGLMLRLQAVYELLPQGEAKAEQEQTLDRGDQVVTESRKAVHDPEISYAERLFRLRIRDAGEGIATAILEDGRPGHYGLRGMREPAAEIGEAGYL